MNKKLFFTILATSIFLIALTQTASANHYYNDYNDGYYSKPIRENPWEKTIEIKKETPYGKSYYYSTKDNYRSSYDFYNRGYNYWQYGPRYNSYFYDYSPRHRYYDYSPRYRYDGYNSYDYGYSPYRNYRYSRY